MSTTRHALLIQEWDRAKLGAQDYIDAMPNEHVGYRPNPDVFTFAGHFLHIADVNLMFAAGAFHTGVLERGVQSENKPELQTKDALRAYVLASYDTLIQGLAACAPETLDEEGTFFKWTMPRHMMLSKAFEHHAHHRGQTAIYFRLLGIKPPSERLF